MIGQSSTHALDVRADGLLVKRFGGADRGEPVREWQALTVLAEHAPGLAPEPVSADLDGAPPSVVMSRLPGHPLRGTSVTGDTVAALAEAVRTLHEAVPPVVLDALPEGAWNVTKAVDKVRGRAARPLPELGTPVVERALAEGRRWLASAPLEGVVKDEPVAVFGHTDGNLANYLYDGRKVRIVDFEDSGRSDRAFELAELAEHPSAWVDSTLDVPALLEQFDLTAAERTRLRHTRRLLALLWLLMLLPDGAGAARNPAGTDERQALRVLERLA